MVKEKDQIDMFGRQVVEMEWKHNLYVEWMDKEGQ